MSNTKTWVYTTTNISHTNTRVYLKVPSYVAKKNTAYFKAFSKKRWMAFSFLEYLFCFRDIHAFVLCKWGKWWCHKYFHLNDKILNQGYLQKYWAVIFKLGTRNVHQRRNRITPCTSLPWTRSFFSSLVLWKFKYPHLQPFWVQQGVFLRTDMVPTLSQLSLSDCWEWMILA